MTDRMDRECQRAAIGKVMVAAMSQYSEDFYAASWRIGLEHSLWVSIDGIGVGLRLLAWQYDIWPVSPTVTLTLEQWAKVRQNSPGYPWNQPLCELCWHDEHPEAQSPVRLPDKPRERCAICGNVTDSGIIVRRDPRTVAYPKVVEDIVSV